MRIVFAGTPDFAVPSLEALVHHGHELVAVYTQPDRRAGRGRQLRPSPVKQTAQHHGLPIRQPVSLGEPAEQQALRELAPDLMVVVAYGLILPAPVLSIPPLGCVNVHASLLPRWRGAAPIQHALLAGDPETGVTLMQMETGLDTGPILASRSCPIAETDTAATLHERLAQLGAALLGDTVDALATGQVEPVPQDDSRATYAPKIHKEDALLQWQKPAATLARQVRAFNPWPVAYGYYDGRLLKVWQARALPESGHAQPGTIVKADADGIDVATGEGALQLLEVQRPGGARIHAGDLVNAEPALAAGQRAFTASPPQA